MAAEWCNLECCPMPTPQHSGKEYFFSTHVVSSKLKVQSRLCPVKKQVTCFSFG